MICRAGISWVMTIAPVAMAWSLLRINGGSALFGRALIGALEAQALVKRVRSVSIL